MRTAGFAYVAFFVVSTAGMALRNVPLQLAGNVTGFVLAVLLYRMFATEYPYLALTLLPLALIHYVIQCVGQLRHDTGTLRLALVPFAPYLIVLGYLVARSTFAPVGLGVLLVVAGLAWLIGVAPHVPRGARLSVIIFGAIVEVVLAITLLTAPDT